MKYSLLVIILLLNCGCSNTKTLKTQHNLRFVIFKSNYELPFEQVTTGRFTPTRDDIDSAEQLLSRMSAKKYNMKSYLRQYVGYTDSNNSKILIINLLKNFGVKKNLHYYKNWENEFIIGFGEIYEKNTISKRINLNKGSVSNGY